jgi:cytochrome P450
MTRDHQEAFRWMHTAHGRTLAMRLLGSEYVSITEPDDVQHVMKDNYRNYGKGTQYAEFEPLWGKSNLLSSHGETWTRQRRVCAPEFQPARGAPYQATIVRRAGELMDSYERSARAGQVRRLYEDVRDLVMRILCEEWFGDVSDRDVREVSRLLNQVTEIIAGRVFVPLKAPLWLPTQRNRRFQRLLAELRVRVRRMIREHADSATDRLNLLGRMLRARQVHDGGASLTMSDAELYDNIIVFLLAAYETPSLGWTLYFIGKHPQVAERIRDEVEHVLGGRTPALEDIDRLAYVRMCVDESLRMFSVSPFLVRQAIADDELSSCRVPAGVNVVVPACVIHHLPQLWPEPGRFMPERFADRSSFHPFSYLPFGKGARECIGRGLALQFSITIIAMLAQRFTYTLERGYQARPRNKFTPHPDGSVPARLTRVAAS